MRDIAHRLEVSISSVSRWTRDIDLSDDQLARLASSDRLTAGQRAGCASQRESARTKRLQAQADGRKLARCGDPAYIAGCMLFWAEGSKDRNTVTLTNADADMVALFVGFLRRFYAVPDEKFRLSLNVHLGNGLSIASIEDWWLARLGLPRSALRAHTVNKYPVSSLRKRRTLPYGTARAQVCCTATVQSIYGAIQEFAGIDRPEWAE